MHFPERLRILLPWLRSFSRSDVRVPLRELIDFLRRPRMAETERTVVLSKKPAGEFIEVQLRGLNQPLFWPTHMDFMMLLTVLDEQYTGPRWHRYEVPETRVESNDVVVDCGAAEGLFSLEVASRCRKLFVFEPLPDFVKGLEQTFRQNANTEIVPAALGERTETARFTADGIASACGPSGTLEIRVVAMDDFFRERPERVSYIKADVEGTEMALLRGAAGIIKAGKPKIAITTYHHRRDAEEIQEYLRSLRPDYRMRLKGITYDGNSTLLHAW